MSLPPSRGLIGERHGIQSVADIPLRIVLIGKDIELRVVSLIIRAREVSDEVVLLDLGSNDSVSYTHLTLPTNREV